MKYKIRAFYDDIGQIIVQYFGDQGETLSSLSIDLPINENNEYPIGEELKRIIEDGFPFWMYDRHQKLKAGIKNKEEIQKLVEPETGE